MIAKVKELISKVLIISLILGIASCSSPYDEKDVLCGSKDFFLSHKVKLSCCTYHRQEDAAVISSLLEGWGYKVSFSDGYMVCLLNGLHPPYFRKGMIYAKNF